MIAAPIRLILLLGLVMSLFSCGGPANLPTPELSSADPLVADIVQRALRKVEQNPASTDAWNDLGRACYANGFFAEADDSLTQSLERNAAQPKTLYLRGMVRRDLYDLPGCLADFDAAMALDPAPHLRWRAAWVAMENGDLSHAIERADQAMDLAPNDRNARRVRARLYLESDSPEQGVALLKPLRAKNPADRDVLWLLVRLLRASGQADQAATLAKAAGTGTPLYSDPWVQWAMAFKANPRVQSRRVLNMLAQGNLIGAERALERFVRFYPENPNGSLLDGMMLAARGRPEAAASRFEQLTLSEPDWAAPWQQLGMLRMQPQSGQRRASREAVLAGIADLGKAVELDSELTAARAALGRAYAHTRQWDAAIEHFTVCVEQSPLEPPHRTNLAVALLQSGRAGEALAVLDASEPMVGSPPGALAARAQSELRLGNVDAAQSTLIRLVEAAPKHPAIPRIRSAIQKARP